MDDPGDTPSSNERWQLLPLGTPEMRVPLHDPGDAAERTRGHARAIGTIVVVAAIVAGIAWVDELLAVLAVIVAVVVFLVRYRRSGGGVRYRAQLREWARERGLEDVGGPIWTWDGSTPVPENDIARATAGAREHGVSIHLGRAVQLRGRLWDAAGAGATITAARVRTPNETVAYVTVVTVPLGAPQVAELPRGIVGIDGYALTDGRLETWRDGNLLLDLAMERWGRATGSAYGRYAGGGDRLLELLERTRDIHRTLVGG